MVHRTLRSCRITSSEEGKVDFWTLTNDPFEQSRFLRKYTEEISGSAVKVSQTEDTILAKLCWANKSGGSEKQFLDALRVYEVQYEKLDVEYLADWVRRLEVEGLWRRIEADAEVL